MEKETLHSPLSTLLSNVTHPFPPVCAPDARILILGSFPSPRSREEGFFYMHPQNRFWPLMADLLGAPLPQTNEERAALLRGHGIALWDVLASCEIRGASDASIQNAVPNDLGPLFRQMPLQTVYTNGKTAYRLYQRHSRTQTGLDAVCLLSTSPANCRVSYAELREAWKVITDWRAAK